MTTKRLSTIQAKALDMIYDATRGVSNFSVVGSGLKANTVTSLIERGLVETTGVGDGTVWLTDAGRAVAEAKRPPAASKCECAAEALDLNWHTPGCPLESTESAVETTQAPEPQDDSAAALRAYEALRDVSPWQAVASAENNANDSTDQPAWSPEWVRIAHGSLQAYHDLKGSQFGGMPVDLDDESPTQGLSFRDAGLASATAHMIDQGRGSAIANLADGKRAWTPVDRESEFDRASTRAPESVWERPADAPALPVAEQLSYDEWSKRGPEWQAREDGIRAAFGHSEQPVVTADDVTETGISAAFARENVERQAEAVLNALRSDDTPRLKASGLDILANLKGEVEPGRWIGTRTTKTRGAYLRLLAQGVVFEGTRNRRDYYLTEHGVAVVTVLRDIIRQNEQTAVLGAPLVIRH